MGHIVGKDIYKKLGKKIDGLSLRVPYTQSFSAILQDLYSKEEADLIARMPYRPSSIDRIERTTGIPKVRLQAMLEKLCDSGLVMDIWNNKKNQYIYMPVPFIIGIYEFTLMRTGNPEKSRHWSNLLHTYLNEGDLYIANKTQGQQIAIMRTIPYDNSVLLNDYVQIFDYQRARAIVEGAEIFAIGLCSCRHEALHMQEKKCNIPLATCCSFGRSAEYLIRHKLARKVDKQEMLDSLARAQELGLMLNGDNEKRNVEYICQCCSCCCHLIKSINKFGYQGILVTSGLLPVINKELCKGCGKCVEACPVHALSRQKFTDRSFSINVDKESCLGCTICQRACTKNAILMGQSDKKVIYPEDGLEKYILSCLEKGTLQNLLFDDPQSLTHEFLRTFLGAFLRLQPVKRALLSNTFRSRFLSILKA
ncbi:MAG: Ferredoxin-2 [Smithella sp. PtaU1.Bin162]|nr:MAG: Ferredoxin-2 [Smithella sp. PtaU1.Bin162]